MTCVIGFAQDGKVTIAGDTAGSNQFYIETRALPKVFKKGKMVFGCSGSFRGAQVLEHVFDIPEHPDKMSDMKYLVGVFMKDLVACFKENSVAETENEKVTTGGNFFIMGYNGCVYTIEADWQVSKTVEDFAATGSGAEFAVGALKALENEKMSVKKRLTKALEISEYFTPSVRGPFNFVSAGGNKK